MFGRPTNARLPRSALDGDSSIHVLFLPPTSSILGGGGRAHSSEVTLLTSRIVGMLTDTLAPAPPAGSPHPNGLGRMGVHGGRCSVLS